MKVGNMAFAYTGSGALEYLPCRYGQSKLLFRGPKRPLSSPFCAALGGTETYGKFVAEPWPELLERRLGLPVVNFGYLNAGVDLFNSEPQMTDMASAARAVVVQLMGAQNMSNRYYAVHPRRNDRFLRASSMMRALFADVDFTEFNFTRHMLSDLQARAPKLFGQLAQELRAAWLARMRNLLEKIDGKVVLLWLGEYRLGGIPDPVSIDSALVEQLRPLVSDIVRVEPSLAARAAGTAGMRFGPMDEPAAAEMPGPLVHAEIAAALAPALAPLL